MSKRFKSLVAFALSLMMLLSIIAAVPVFAAEESDVEEDKLDDKPYLKTIYGSVDAKIAVMTEGLSNGKMQIYYDAASGEVAIKNLETNEVLFTNPYNVSSSKTA